MHLHVNVRLTWFCDYLNNIFCLFIIWQSDEGDSLTTSEKWSWHSLLRIIVLWLYKQPEFDFNVFRSKCQPHTSKISFFSKQCFLRLSCMNVVKVVTSVHREWFYSPLHLFCSFEGREDDWSRFSVLLPLGFWSGFTVLSHINKKCHFPCCITLLCPK